MLVYDYKFPTLAKTLFYQFCKNRKSGELPKDCGFRIVNFTDVEYSNRINPIQRKYIPDLAGASETAATLLASLDKGGGEKKGGSEAFFTNSAENFLVAIIYFFVNFHPGGFRNGKKLKRFILHEGRKLEIVIRSWDDSNALGVMAIYVFDQLCEHGPLCFLSVMVFCGIAWFLQSDFDWRGVLMIVLFYMHRSRIIEPWKDRFRIDFPKQVFLQILFTFR